MDDKQWLSTRIFDWRVDNFSLPPNAGATAGLVVAPSYVARAARLDAPVLVSVAGYPTGRHHTLVKAAEARLAVQSGAQEVWVCVDWEQPDSNAHLAELITIRDACPHPARLGLIVPPSPPMPPHTLTATAQHAGFERVIVPPGAAHDWPLESVVLLGSGAVEAAVDQLQAGADFVALARHSLPPLGPADRTGCPAD